MGQIIVVFFFELGFIIYVMNVGFFSYLFVFLSIQMDVGVCVYIDLYVYVYEYIWKLEINFGYYFLGMLLIFLRRWFESIVCILFIYRFLNF